jgi:hypothetical protein
MHNGRMAFVRIKMNCIVMHGMVDALIVIELKLEVELILLVEIKVGNSPRVSSEQVLSAHQELGTFMQRPMSNMAHSWSMVIGLEKIGGIGYWMIEKRKLKLCQVVVGCALAFLLASRNSRSKPRQVEKGTSTQPIDATSFVEG